MDAWTIAYITSRIIAPKLHFISIRPVKPNDTFGATVITDSLWGFFTALGEQSALSTLHLANMQFDPPDVFMRIFRFFDNLERVRFTKCSHSVMTIIPKAPRLRSVVLRNVQLADPPLLRMLLKGRQAHGYPRLRALDVISNLPVGKSGYESESKHPEREILEMVGTFNYTRS